MKDEWENCLDNLSTRKSKMYLKKVEEGGPRHKRLVKGHQITKEWINAP